MTRRKTKFLKRSVKKSASNARKGRGNASARVRRVKRARRRKRRRRRLICELIFQTRVNLTTVY